MYHPSPERRSPEQMMRPTALRILVGAASAVLALMAGPAHAQRVDTRIIHERAIEQPFDEHRFQAYLGTLPRDGDYASSKATSR